MLTRDNHSPGCTTVVYRPPDSRKFRFLAERPLQMHVAAYRSPMVPNADNNVNDRRSDKQDCLCSIARESFATDFTRQKAECADLSIVIQHINLAGEIRQVVESGTLPSLQLNEMPSAGSGWGTARFLEVLVVTTIALLNYRPLGGNALKDVSATGQ